MIEGLIAAIAALLGALAPVAPEIVRALTGGQDAGEAIRKAREAAQRLVVREDDGTWDADLAARKARGAIPPLRRTTVDVELGDMPSSVRLPGALLPIGERETPVAPLTIPPDPYEGES